MAAKEVDSIVFEQMKIAYSRKFGSSPTRLIQKLNVVYEHEINISQSSSGDLISDKTIRNFFKSDSSHLPKTQEKNLNYLCSVLLDIASYQDALEQFAQTENNEQEEWLSPYWDYIKDKCGTMQVLDMALPVHLDNIYTKVNIWERRRKQRKIEEILAILDEDKQESSRLFSVDSESKKQISALEAVRLHRKLMVLGLPGSGKTTLSKHIAMHFREEELTQQVIPVYIELKKFVEDESRLSLINAVIKEFDQCIRNSGRKIQRYLEQGQCIILLDGLDEVRDADIKWVTRNIDEIVNQYPKNRFVITCRVAANEYVFNGFTVVEIADFEQEQVEKFVYNWFQNRTNLKQGKEFLANLRENPSIEKLTRNPLVLTILCVLFEHGYNLSKHRHSLYEDVVNVFLERWDASRQVKRDPISPEPIEPNQNIEKPIKREQLYREKLTRRRKINLFTDIAYHAFIQEPPKLFWWQWELEELIRKFIHNLPGVEPENLDVDSKDILKAIETNHGLLVEQASKYYSFSHLTFQEYFTAQYILDNRSTNLLKNIVEKHLLNRQWHEVFLIVAGRLPNIDELLKFMLQKVNTLVKSNALQEMLKWLNKITISSGVNSSSWRAFFLAVSLDIELYFDGWIDVDRNLAQKLAANLRSFNKEQRKIILRTPQCTLVLYLAVVLTLAFDFASNSNFSLQKANDYIQSNLEVETDLGIESKLENTIQIAKELMLNDLAEKLTDMLASLPTSHRPDSNLAWLEWADNLQKLLIQHLDIGHRVSLSEDDARTLENYIYVNQLIVESLKGDSYSSKDLREKILDSLFLPNELISSVLLPS